MRTVEDLQLLTIGWSCNQQKKHTRHENENLILRRWDVNFYFGKFSFWSSIDLKGLQRKVTPKDLDLQLQYDMFYPFSSHCSIFKVKGEREVTNEEPGHPVTAPPSDRTISPGSQVQQHSHESVTGLRCNLHHVVWSCGFLFKHFKLMLFEYHKFSWKIHGKIPSFQGSFVGLTFPSFGKLQKKNRFFVAKITRIHGSEDAILAVTIGIP